jgi:hypothetical protein
LNARWCQHDPVAVFFPGHGAFGLAPIQFDHALIGFDGGKGLIQGRIRNTGAASIGVSLAQLSSMLATPVDFKINQTYIGTTGFGSSTDVKAAKVKGYMMLFLSAPVATLEDPSWLKTTSRDASGFAGVMQYRDNTCNSDIFYVEAQESVTAISALMAVVITVE